MFICDLESFAFLAVNQAATLRYGYSQQEFLSMTFLEIRPPEDIPKFLEYFSLLDADSRDVTMCRHRKKNGAIIDVAVSLWTIEWAGRQSRLALACDLTSQNRIDDALRKSEERFRTAFAQAAIGFVITDLDGRYVSANHAFSSIVGYSEEELCGMSFQQLTHPDDLPADLASRQRFLNGEISSFVLHKRYVAKSGQLVWVQNSVGAIHDSAGVLVGFVALSEDITQRKHMEAVLRESEDRYRDLVGHSTDLICTHDLQGRLLSVNELPATLLGYSSAELLAKPMRDFVRPELRSGFDEYLKNIQRDGFAKGVVSVLAKSGEPRIWEFHNTLRTEGVSVPIVRGVAHDVTEQKRMESQLRLSEEKFAKAFRCSSNLIWISTAKEDRLIEINDGFERHTGYSRPEVIGHTSADFQLWRDPVQRTALLETLQKLGHARDQEVCFRVKSGKFIIVLLSVELIELRRDSCLLAVGQVITDRKRAEQELRLLSGQLLLLQDAERRRIARELHDSTGQNLTALAAMLDQVRASIPSSSRKSRKLLAQCQSLANLSMREIRTLSYLLHPPLLDESGIEDAIRHYLDGFEKRSGLRVDLQVSPSFARLSRDIELALFRVVQESLTNIHRHSGGRLAKIRLDRNAREVTLTVSDDGHGTSRGTNPCLGTPLFGIETGVGIPSMLERVKLIGGELAILSDAAGTTVRVTLPAADHP